jgi:TolB-like protein/Flp pilus assembly protein TadD
LSPTTPTPALLERLKDRKLVQWALAYAAAAWLVMQLVDVLGARWSWPTSIQRAIDIALAAGFIGVLVLAWYHGEQGRQRASGPELLILAMLFFLGALGVRLLVPARLPASAAAAAEPAAAEFDDPRPSIAVLPFANRSGQEEDRYFTDGFHDEVLTHLATVSGLRVIARTSVEPYRNAPKRVRDVGTDLDVRYLLEGGVQRSGSRVHVNLQLIDAATEEHLGAEVYDRQLNPDSLLDLQSEIARTVAGRLRIGLRIEENRRLARRSTSDPEAYDLWLRAISVYGDVSKPNAQRFLPAIEYLERAVQRDPEFAHAHALLGNVHALTYQWAVDRSDERARNAKASADRALEIDPDLAAGHYALAYYYYRVAQDYIRAMEEIERIGDRLGGDFDLLYLRGIVQRRMGQWDASLRSFQRALAIAPSSGTTSNEIGVSYLFLRRYDEAVQLFSGIVERAPDNLQARGYLAEAEYLRGNLDVFRAGNRASPSPTAWYPQFLLRDWPRLRTLVPDDTTQLENQYGVTPRRLTLAFVESAAGDSARARTLFEQAATALERMLRDRPDDDRLHRSLGYAYAGLGRAADATREGERALELLPPEKDAMSGSFNLYGLALIHSLLGNADRALPLLERFLANPGRESAHTIARDARFDRIRNDPRFTALVRQHGAAL